MIAAYIVVSLLLGGTVGYFSQSDPEPAVERHLPRKWDPMEHDRAMMTCRSMCNKQVLSYDALTGECICKL